MDSYDAWKLRTPEDERGQWGNLIDCGDYYHRHHCDNCGDYLMVCGACDLCEECHRKADGIDPDEARADSGLDEE